jgi:hypothetical protein
MTNDPCNKKNALLFTSESNLTQHIIVLSHKIVFKGIVAQDFWDLIFFINQHPIGPDEQKILQILL